MIRNKIKLMIVLVIVMICVLGGCGTENVAEKILSKDYTLIEPQISMNNLQNMGRIAGDNEYLYFSVNNIDGFNQMNLKTGEVKQISPDKAEGIAIYNNGVIYTQDGLFNIFNNKDFSNQSILQGWRLCSNSYSFDNGIFYFSGGNIRYGKIKDGDLPDHSELIPIDLSDMAIYGDYIYGNDSVDIINGSVNANKGFWKIKKDGSEKIKLLEVPVEQFVVEGEYIYYIQNKKLWRIDVNGENSGEYGGIDIYSHLWYEEELRIPLQVFQQKLYFCTKNGFYNVNVDGTGLAKINDNKPIGIYIVNDSLYYYDDDGLYIMDLINNQVSQIWKESYAN